MQSMLPSIYSSKTTAQHRAPKNAHTHHGKSSSKNLAILFRAHRITDRTTLPSIYTGALRAAAVRNRSDNSDEFFLRSREHAGRRLHEYIQRCARPFRRVYRRQRNGASAIFDPAFCSAKPQKKWANAFSDIECHCMQKERERERRREVAVRPGAKGFRVIRRWGLKV